MGTRTTDLQSTYYGDPSELGSLLAWKQDIILQLDTFVKKVVSAATGNSHAAYEKNCTVFGADQYNFAVRELIQAQYYLKKQYGVITTLISMGGHSLLTFVKGGLVIRVTFQKAADAVHTEALSTPPPRKGARRT